MSLSGLFGLGQLEEVSRVQAVWERGRLAPNLDPKIWRHDDFNSLIRRSDYGDRSSIYGWEIDHITPTALGGADAIWNLRPLHCKTNAGLGGLLGGLLNR